MGNRKTVAFNTFSQIIGKTITSATTFIISILIAKSLGATGYGEFTKITTFVAFFYLLADFGLNAAYLELSDQKDSHKTLLTLRTALGILLVFLCLSITVFLPGSDTGGYTPGVKFGIIIFSINIILQSLITTTNAFFQKHLRYDFASYALTAGSLITLGVVFVLPNLGISGVTPMITALLFGSFATGITALFFAVKLLPSLSFSFNPDVMKKMATIAFPLGLTLLCNVVYFHADSVVLTLTRSTAEVGIYGFAYKLFEFPLVIPTFFMNAVFPLLLLSKKTEDLSAFLRQARQSAGILFSLSLIILIIGFMSAPLFSVIKSDFAASILPFRILLFSLPIFYLTSVTMWVLIALKKRFVLFSIYFISMIGNIVSNIVFVPTHGVIAAAWITVASEAFVLLLSFILIQRCFNANAISE